ncbi:hypothetical protein CHS0354_023443 [Potamilus streckersoni]|uniref:Uncharacterized protein n=1 Tax=Potamilus streckersoni TaxID=2493646 RepID=A0AAE0VMB5_9BIVA|nr:hypothetical protein CHS0354_023443 [Potamilus streckersoni]
MPIYCEDSAHLIDVTPEIPELLSSRITVSVPPGSTKDPFQSPYQNGRPITARVRDSESGQNIKDGKKRKVKREKKTVEKDNRSAIVDGEYGEIETNSKTNIERLERPTNGNLSDVNGKTGHSNGEDKDNTRKRKKKKRKRMREDSYTDDKVNNSSAEPGSDFVFKHHSKRTITLESPDRVQVTEKQPYQPNDKVSDGRREKMEQHEMLSETKIETLAQKYDELVFAPAETLVIEKQKDLYIERIGRKYKKKRRKENEMVDEDGVEQDGLNLKEEYKEPNNGSIATHKEKKKKRKKSRERSEEKVLNGYDELVDAPAANLVLEERTDLQNEGPNKKHKKRKKKKDKQRGDENVV